VLSLNHVYGLPLLAAMPPATAMKH
jgi:hypothetical protein